MLRAPIRWQASGADVRLLSGAAPSSHFEVLLSCPLYPAARHCKCARDHVISEFAPGLFFNLFNSKLALCVFINDKEVTADEHFNRKHSSQKKTLFSPLFTASL